MIEVVTSYCRVCPALCGIEVEVDRSAGRVLHVRGDKLHAMSQGYTCVKGRSLPEEVHAPDRLTGALRRTVGGFEPLATDQAIEEIAEHLNAIIEEHGPRAVAMYVGTRGYEVLQLTGARAWLRGIGSPGFYSTYTIDQPGKDLARARHGSWPAGFQDVVTSDVVLLVGTNPVVSTVTSYIGMPMTNIRMELRRMRARGLRLLVIDPRRTETAAIADVHLRPRPGTDALVLAGMLRVIVSEARHDEEFVTEYTQGFESLARTVDVFTPEFVEEASGVPSADLIEAARSFALGPRGCAVGGTGINMSPHPTLNEYLLLCLNSVCGRYRRAGEQVTNPGVLTAGRSLAEGPRGPRPITGRGDAQPRVRDLQTFYDQMPSAALADEILTSGEGQVRALIVSGGNPLVALPDAQKTRRALESLELLVSLDVRMAQTAAISDYVVACPMSLEKSDATLASDLRFPAPFAQYTAPVVAPAPGLIEEWDFFRRLSHAMGSRWDLEGRVGMPIPLDVGELLADEPTTTDELWERLCSSGAVPLREVRAHPHGLLAELPNRIVESTQKAVADSDRLQFADPVMLEELRVIARDAPITMRDSEWPFLLTSRRMNQYYNSWGQDVPAVRERSGANPAFVHPDDLAILGLVDGDVALIESQHGTIRVVVAAAPDVATSTVSIAHCWGVEPEIGDVRSVGSQVNALVSNEEPISDEVGMARQSAIPVRIRPVVRGRDSSAQ
ncbi:MAG TPA: molybdopterin-dependent oxidoreductase [Acidimicrobiia bacterium]